MPEPKRRLRIISDNAIRDGREEKPDELGFGAYARTLAQVIVDNDEALTVGVFGEWGTGKTSLLQLIQEELDKDRQNCMTVWFNAWRYEREEHPLVPLLNCILAELESGPAREFLGDPSLGIAKTLRTGLSSLLASLSISAKVPGVDLKFDGDKFLKQWKKEGGRTLPSTMYVDAFRALDKVTLPKGKSLVVIVDDLDRCMPSNAVRLLEAIKLAMARPGFVFVLGVSPRMIHDYLRHRYSEEFGVEEFSGREYLEKIVQLPFYLPDQSERMKDFSESLLTAVPVEEHDRFAEITPLIESVCKNVPRAAIRFFNAILVAGAIYDNICEEEQGRVPLIAFAVDRLLQLVWRDTYELLLREPSMSRSAYSEWSYDSIPNAEDFKTGSDPGRILADMMRHDAVLRRLFFSAPCGEWLGNDRWRTATSSFQITREEREMSSVSGYVPADSIQELGVQLMELTQPALHKVQFNDELVRRLVRVRGGFDMRALPGFLWRLCWKDALGASRVLFDRRDFRVLLTGFTDSAFGPTIPSRERRAVSEAWLVLAEKLPWSIAENAIFQAGSFGKQADEGLDSSSS